MDLKIWVEFRVSKQDKTTSVYHGRGKAKQLSQGAFPRESKFSFRLQYSLLPSAALAEGNFYQKWQIPGHFKLQGPCLCSLLQLES